MATLLLSSFNNCNNRFLVQTTVSDFLSFLLPFGIGKFIALGSVLLFGFSCIISYYNYAEQSASYIFGEKSRLVVRLLWVITVFVGSQTTLGFVWDLADTFNGLMIIPNLIGIILLSSEVIALKKEYFEKLK